MVFVASTFRTTFPEFSDTVKYPDAMISFWAGIAQQQVRLCVWNNMWLNGVYLYTAHEITIAALNAKAGKIGGTPGTSGGIANSKTVGGASIAFDSATQSEKDAGWWNRTTYGQQFIRLARIFGAGAIQL